MGEIMTTAQDVLNVARSLIGIHETPDGSNIAHPITDWAAKYGYSSGDAWCSWTVSYEFYHTDPALIYNHPSGYSGDFRLMGEQHGLVVPGPQVGAIDVMDFDGKPDFTDHVGIVESVNADGSWVNIEGNHNNQVMRVNRRPGGGSHWFILPKYSEVSKPPTKPKEDNVVYEQYGEEAFFGDLWQDRFGYYLHTCGDSDNVVFRLIQHNNSSVKLTDPQPVRGHQAHDLQRIVANPKYTTVGSYGLACTSDKPIHWTLREVPK